MTDRFKDQTLLGKTGNCFTACLASLFNLEIVEVPNFFEVAGEDPTDWWKAVRDWLRPRGYGIISLSIARENLSEYEGFLIVCGESPRGVNHATIWQYGKMVHDPHPDKSGIVEVASVDLLYPLDPSLMRLK